jgi:hypothetical protein
MTTPHLTGSNSEPGRGARGERAQRDWRRGARWFAAQFVVVVAGVLVALALNAWWQERRDRARERIYLQQLVVDLAATETELAAAHRFFLDRAQASARVAQAFWRAERPAVETLLPSLSAPLSSRRYRPVLGTIHALVATGDLGLIRSDALRTELMAYMDAAQAKIEDIQRFDETYYRRGVDRVREGLDPALLTHLNQLAASVPQARRTELSSLPGGERRPPFANGIEGFYRNSAIYDAYGTLLIAHRNQAYRYLEIIERARRLRGEVYRQLHGVRDPGNCQLVPVGDRLAGECGALGTGTAELTLTLSEVASASSGRWSREWTAYRVWAGEASADGLGTTPIEVEVDIAGDGVARTQFGWFAVHSLANDPETGHLSFRLNLVEVESNETDAEILNRARELLADEQHWDRADDRDCAPDATTFSLYCALHRASLEIAGGFHHRRPALQRVRALVEARTAGRRYEHRLRDYNNDPTIRLADLHALLDDALAGESSATVIRQSR